MSRERIESEGLFKLKKHPEEGTCCVSRCSKGADNRRKKVGNCWFCDKHWQFRWRNRDKKMATYRMLVDHAKQRGLVVEFSYEYFKGLTDAFGYWQHEAGTRAEHLSIDRVDPRLPYREGNVRIITVSENSVKSHREAFLSPEVREHVLRRRARLQAVAEKWDGVDEEDRNPF